MNSASYTGEEGAERRGRRWNGPLRDLTFHSHLKISAAQRELCAGWQLAAGGCTCHLLPIGSLLAAYWLPIGCILAA